jgi:hypothetical protein
LSKTVERALGLLLYTTGIVMGVGFAAAITWAHYEASLFDLGLPADVRVDTLRCPTLLTAGEEGAVTASFSNPSDRPARRVIRASITDGFVTFPRQEETRTVLEPGETIDLSWTITPADAAWERLILVRIYALRTTPLPSMTGTCGTVYVGLAGISGQQLTVLLLVGFLLSTVGGFWLWLRNVIPLQGRIHEVMQAMAVLAGLVLVGLVAALMGWWLLTGLLLAVAVLLLIGLFYWFGSPR